MKSKLQPIEKQSNLQKAKILIIDDEPGILSSLKILMETYLCTVATAEGGIQACQELLKTSYDLVLLDINMKDMSGHDVMDFMAEHKMKAPVIILSAEASFTAASKALRRGAQDYIKKPYDAEELITTIINTITKKRLEDDNLEMQQKMKESEDLYRHIVNTSPDIIYMMDHKGRFIFLNSQIEKLLGYGKNELIGKHFTAVIDAEHITKLKSFIRDKAHNKLGGHPFETIELRISGKKSSTDNRIFEITLFPVESETIRPLPKNKTPNSEKFAGYYGTARDVTERKKAEDCIRFQADHDVLTSLPNRALFKGRGSIAINRAHRNCHRMAVLFIDLDNFKRVNDTLGHASGDRLLQEVARRMDSCIRDVDTLARFGGDEFMLLLPDIRTSEDAGRVARKILDALQKPFMLKNHEIFVNVSIGISTFPDNGDDIESLIQNADAAMFEAKACGKGNISFFKNEMKNSTRASLLELENDLRRAVTNKDFIIHYQPQMEIMTGKIIGVEALVRWNHPKLGMISPIEFISLAEETKLIGAIGEWVLRSSCSEVRKWIKDDYSALRLSVNFSSIQIKDPCFVENLLQILAECAFPTKNFEVELTESALMTDIDRIAPKLNQLQEQSITLAIDDFGTGYSSMSYLKKLPVHTLKIDQSFIQERQGAESEANLVRAIIAMGRGLKLNTVAEGVETCDQLEFLRSSNCHAIQGYYFGKPQIGERTLQLLMENL
ncbi:MAG: EAL domain-containing protein [Candidatus Brocadiaceae bacterium]|nr:EAL domain-containing protein [Candidatus Brocadiaceae bacterium]